MAAPQTQVPDSPTRWSNEELDSISLELADLDESGDWEQLPGESILFSFPCTGEPPTPRFETRSQIRTFVELESGFTIDQVVFSFADAETASELLMGWEQQLLQCPGLPVDGGADGVQLVMLGLPAQASGDETRVLLDYQDGTGRPLRETVGAWDRHDNIVVYVAIGQRGLRTTGLDDALEVLRGIVGAKADELIGSR
ncbi:MAG: hypothetical protein GXP35_16825 [Actinobacteria bacterium]|nr:hypothetical protein [Actinomycetota bacterium]